MMEYVVFEGKVYTLESVELWYDQSIVDSIKADTVQELFDAYIKIDADLPKRMREQPFSFQEIGDILSEGAHKAKESVNYRFKHLGSIYHRGLIEAAKDDIQYINGLISGIEDCGILRGTEITDMWDRLHYAQRIITPEQYSEVSSDCEDRWHDFD